MGSDAWCEKLEEKPKGKWTVDEKGQHTKYCVFGRSEEADETEVESEDEKK